MGITGLLPFVKKASRSIHLNELSGSTVAVDAYCWLHKGGFACAEALALNKPTDKYVGYVMKYIRLLQGYNIKVILVFDGASLPSKKDTEMKRRESRESYRKKAAQFLAEGKKAEARECFERSVNVTHQMANNVMKAARGFAVDCIVAPYEADSQLAYLNIIGIADYIITEDSDLLLFGCSKVIFKLDPTGSGILVERDRLSDACSIKPDLFTMDKFRFIGILAGCDYFPGISGIGLASACKVMQKTRLDDLKSILSKLHLYTSKQLAANITPDVIKSAEKAFNTFLYQVVFDPISKSRRPLNDYPPGKTAEDFPYAGKYISSDLLSYQLALGNRDPDTYEIVDNFDPDRYKPHTLVKILPTGHDRKSGNVSSNQPSPPHLLSIWSPDYQIAPRDNPSKKIARVLKECNRYAEQGRKRWQKLTQEDNKEEDNTDTFPSTVGRSVTIEYHLPSIEFAAQIGGTTQTGSPRIFLDNSLDESFKESSIGSQYSFSKERFLPSSTSFDISLDNSSDKQTDELQDDEDVGDLLERACSPNNKVTDFIKSPIFSRKRSQEHIPMFEKSPTFQPVEKKAKFNLDSFQKFSSSSKSSPAESQTDTAVSSVNSDEDVCRSNRDFVPEDRSKTLPGDTRTKISICSTSSVSESLKKSFNSSFRRFWNIARPNICNSQQESGSVTSSGYFSTSQSVPASLGCCESSTSSEQASCSSQPNDSKSFYSFKSSNRLSAAYKCSLVDQCSDGLSKQDPPPQNGSNAGVTKTSLTSSVPGNRPVSTPNRKSTVRPPTASPRSCDSRQTSLDAYLNKWKFKRKDQLKLSTVNKF